MLDGVSMVFAPRGFTCIFHVMRFPWDAASAPKAGIGATDTELIESWPGCSSTTPATTSCGASGPPSRTCP